MPWSFPGGSGVKNLLAKQEMCSFPGSIPGWVRKNPWWRACNPLQCSCWDSFTDRRACWATVHGVAKSRAGLK